METRTAESKSERIRQLKWYLEFDIEDPDEAFKEIKKILNGEFPK